MTKTLATLQQPTDNQSNIAIKESIISMIDEMIISLPSRTDLTMDQQRGIIARYTAVLEGNFIYWMTAAYIAVQSDEARTIIMENLLEEVRDAHPAMLRSFTIAAAAYPTETDALGVHDCLTKVRLFLGRLSGVQSVVMMALFEGFIQRFMQYLAELAIARGSAEMEYTDVHSACDIEHTEGLFRALAAEMAVNPPDPAEDLFEGANYLRALIKKIVFN